MLVITPKPEKDESLAGYILRVSESNGYSSPSPVLSIAGYKDVTFRSTRFDWKPLSKVLGNINLSSLSYDSLTPVLTENITHSRATPGLWSINSPRICPICIKEKGYIESHWDLAYMVACPEHGNLALSQCHECGSQLKWNREGLLNCRCGANFRNAPIIKASDEVLYVVTVLKHLFYKDEYIENINNITSALTFDSNQISCYELVCLIKMLSKHCPVSSIRGNDIELNVALFGEIISNWPKNYYQYLENIRYFSEKENEEKASLVQQYFSFYQSLKSNKKIKTVAKVLISEFIKYGFEVHGKTLVDERLKKRLIGEYEPRFVSPSQAARISGLSPVTLRKWARKGLINSTTSKSGQVDSLILDISGDAVKSTADGLVLGLREASAYVGLPVSVFRRIEESDFFVHDNKSKEKYGFHVDDLEQFKSKFFNRAIGCKSDMNQDCHTYNFEHILKRKRFRVSDGKLKFLKAYMDGSVKPVTVNGLNLKEIFFSVSDVNQFIEVLIKSRGIETLKISETAKIISFPNDVIGLLYNEGYLSGENDPGLGLRLVSESVYNFKKTYCSLNSLSKSSGTGIKKLLSLCNDQEPKIAPFYVKRPSGRKCHFLGKADSTRLLNVVKLFRDEEKERRELLKNKTSKQELLENYFSNLRKSGLKLPRLGRRPNIVAVAKEIDGLSRHDFYPENSLKAMLDEYDEEEQNLYPLRVKENIDILKEYLRTVLKNGKGLPLNNNGKPNLSRIARSSGVSRWLFYGNETALELVYSTFHDLQSKVN